MEDGTLMSLYKAEKTVEQCVPIIEHDVPFVFSLELCGDMWRLSCPLEPITINTYFITSVLSRGRANIFSYFHDVRGKLLKNYCDATNYFPFF